MISRIFARRDIGALLEQYGTILRQAWRTRRDTDTPVRLASELAFLPAHLELTETPPHPAPLWTARILLGVAFVTVLIAAFGRLDIVAIATGQLIPNANVKVIQPAVTGIVRSILVQNGERVVAGQPVVDLDSTLATADANKAKSSTVEAQLTIARAHALLTAQERNAEPQVASIAGAPAARQTDTQGLAEGTFREYRDKVAELQAELQRREAELDTTRHEISKLEQTAPIARRQADDYKELSERGFVAFHDFLAKEATAIEQDHELAAQKSRATEFTASIDQQQRTINSTVATFQREQWEILNKAEQEIAQTRDEEEKSAAREGFMHLRSPVAGVVQQLSVHTVGGVVTGAQSLMEIVPDDSLEVEAHVSNKDIGFVSPGQSVIVKITTFPYARFGYLKGTVTRVANDATSDRKLGLVFLARIRIPSNRFKVESKWLDLSPGMEVSAEIKVGTQKVWQYFLSPLIDTGHESLRER